MKCSSPTGAQPLSTASAREDMPAHIRRPTAAPNRRYSFIESSASGHAACGRTLTAWCAACQLAYTGVSRGLPCAQHQSTPLWLPRPSRLSLAPLAQAEIGGDVQHPPLLFTVLASTTLLCACAPQ